MNSVKFTVKDVGVQHVIMKLIDSPPEETGCTLDITNYFVTDGIWHVEFSNADDAAKFEELIDDKYLFAVK